MDKINIKITDISKTDLTEFSENELSLMVFNDEYLYKMRRNKKNLIATLDDMYIYTDEQLEVLNNDLDEDEKDE